MNAQNVLLGFLVFFLISLLFFLRMLWLTISRRKRILTEGPLVNATVTHYDEIFTKGGRLNRSRMVFKTLAGNKVEVVHLTPKKGKIYPVGMAVVLQYDPIKPTRFIIQDGEVGRWFGIGIILFGIVSSLVSFFGLYWLYNQHFT